MATRRRTSLMGIAPILFGLVLAGCNGGPGGLGLGGADTAPRQALVTTDRLIIGGPEGWCIDQTATRDAGTTAFVLLGNCAAISNSRRAPQPAVPAVLTAAISAPSDTGTIGDSMSDLDNFFRSEEGRRLLSRAQDADTVEVLETQQDGELFLLHARDTSATSIPGVQQDYWRAYLDLGARIATLSVLGLQDREVRDDQALLVLRNFAAHVRSANPVGVDGVTPLPADPALAPPPLDLPPPVMPVNDSADPLYDVGFFRRILG